MSNGWVSCMSHILMMNWVTKSESISSSPNLSMSNIAIDGLEHTFPHWISQHHWEYMIHQNVWGVVKRHPGTKSGNVFNRVGTTINRLLLDVSLRCFGWMGINLRWDRSDSTPWTARNLIVFYLGISLFALVGSLESHLLSLSIESLIGARQSNGVVHWTLLLGSKMLHQLAILWTSSDLEMLASHQLGGFWWVLVLVVVEMSSITKMTTSFVMLVEVGVGQQLATCP